MVHVDYKAGWEQSQLRIAELEKALSEAVSLLRHDYPGTAYAIGKVLGERTPTASETLEKLTDMALEDLANTSDEELLREAAEDFNPRPGPQKEFFEKPMERLLWPAGFISKR